MDGVRSWRGGPEPSFSPSGGTSIDGVVGRTGWGHTSLPWWDGSMLGTWRIQLGELCGMNIPRSPAGSSDPELSAQGTQKIQVGSQPALAKGRTGMLLAQSHREHGSFMENYSSTGPGT